MYYKLIKTTLATGLTLTVLTGCATTALINKGHETRTKSTKVTLVEDTVVAFGQPAQTITNIPPNSLVIAGQKHSYVLTQGGAQFAKLITTLDPENIQMTGALNFESKNNDGYFAGVLPLSYVKLQEDLNKKDLAFFIENRAEECSTASDKRMNAQRFCFNLQLSGVVYPVASNVSSLKALSKPYQVSIHTTKQESYRPDSNLNPLKKLVLLPFAVAFDVIAIPFQAIGVIME